MRTILMVIDGFGIGALPDANEYGDEGSNTFLNINNASPFNLPNFEKLGLYNIDGLWLKCDETIASYGRIREISKGKDTTTGHYEMMDIITETPNPVFSKFPDEIVNKIEKAIGTKIIGNYAESGTKIINDLGQEHYKTGYPIVYTSADSVLQVATHTDKYSIEQLYDMCSKIREIMTDKYNVSRVIARPFAGENGKYYRLEARKDYALLPPKKSILDTLKDNGIDTISIGKIYEIFSGQGISKKYIAKNNKQSIDAIIQSIEENDNCFIFANLVDTDMLFGHRNDILGYKKAIEEIDCSLTEIIGKMDRRDILMITGDHGCDPTTTSTDHSREYTPLLVFSKSIHNNKNLGTIKGMNYCGKIALEYFGLSDKNILKELQYE